MSTTPGDEIVAKIRAQWDTAGILTGVETINSALKQLGQGINLPTLDALLHLDSASRADAIAAIGAIQQAYEKLDPAAKLAGQAAAFLEQQQQKQAAAAEQQQQKQAAAAEQAAAANDKFLDSLMKTAAEAQNMADELTAAYNQVGASILKNLAGGNISGLWQQFTNGDFANANLQGGLQSIGGGLLQSLGIDTSTNAALAEVTGGVLLLGQAVIGLGEDYLKAYNAGQQWLAQTELLQKQVGLNAQQASQLESMTVFAGAGGSMGGFMSASVLERLQSNLQVLTDYENGIGEATPQVQKMADGLQRLGLKATDASHNVKDLVTFTMEMSQALQGLDPGRYAQAIQEISGMFGIGFAGIVGTQPQVLAELASTSVQVTQQQLSLSNERVAAVQEATNAEMQFNLTLTEAIAPLDIILQHIKAITLFALSGNPGGRNILGMSPQEMEQMREQIDGIVIALNPIVGAALMSAQTGAMQAAQQKASVLAGTTDNTVSPQVALKNEQQMLGDLSKLAQAGMDADKAAAKAYTDQLHDLGTELDRVNTNQKNLIDADKAAITGFENTLTSVVSAAKGYDSYYKSYEDTYKKIDDLTKKANTSVATYSYVNPQTGEASALSGSAKDIQKYYDDFNKATAQQLTNTERMAAQAETLADRVNATKKKTMSATQALNMSWYTSGGSPLQQFEAQQQQDKLAAEAAKIGLPEGAPVTTESLKQGWTKAGLSTADQNTLDAAWESVKALGQQNSEAQFDVMVKGMGNYVKSLIPLPGALKETADAQADFLASGGEMARLMQDFADKAGLFQSVGFDRAIMEAALQAKLATGGFGTGAAALDDYAKAAQGAYDFLTKFQDQLSGRNKVKTEDLVSAGLITADQVGAKMPTTGRAGGTFNPELADTTTAVDRSKTISQISLAQQAQAGTLSGSAFFQAWSAQAGIDTQKGITDIYNQAYGSVNKGGQDAANQIVTDLTTALKEPIAVSLKIDGDSITVLKQQIQDALQNVPTTSAGDTTATAMGKAVLTAAGLDTTGITDAASLKAKTTDLTSQSKEPGYQPPGFFSGQPPATSSMGARNYGMQTSVSLPATTVSSLEADVQKTVKQITDHAKVDPLSQIDVPTTVNKEDAKQNFSDARAFVQNFSTANPITMHVKVVMDYSPAGAASPAGNAAPPPLFPPLFPTGSVGAGTGGGTPWGLPTYNRSVNTYGSPNSYAPPSKIVNIDARGSMSPTATVKAVEAAASIFIADDPAVAARALRRRRGLNY